jgi:hypothetical protein
MPATRLNPLLRARPPMLIVTAEADGYIAPEELRSPGMPGLVRVPSDSTPIRVNLPLIKASTVTGTLVDDVSKKPIGGVTVRALQRVYRNGEAYLLNRAEVVSGPDGVFSLTDVPRGEYVFQFIAPPRIEIGAEKARPDAELTESRGYGIVYLPGQTREAPEFAAISISAGAATDLGKLRLPQSGLHEVAGTVSGVDCLPGESMTVALVQSKPGETEIAAKQRVACGPFRIRNVPDGHYQMEVGRDVTRPGQEKSFLAHGIQELDLRHGERVRIDLRRPTALPALLRLEGSLEKRLPEGLEKCQVRLVPLSRVARSIDVYSPLAPDGSFERAVFPRDTYRVEVERLPDSYYLKRVIYCNRELGDGERLEILDVPSQSLILELSNRPAAITGQLELGDSKSATGCSMVLARADLSGYRQAVTRVTWKPGAGGEVRKAGLRPGEYRIFALPEGRLPALERPGVLSRSAAAGSGAQHLKGRLGSGRRGTAI